MGTLEKQELEPKHIAGYLPHKLKGIYSGLTNVEVYQLTIHPENGNLYIKYKWLKKDGTYYHSNGLVNNGEFKLILHPLSDLTKEIEHNGKKFVPMEVLFGCEEKEEEAFNIYGKIPEYWKSLLKVDIPGDWEYGVVNSLFEWKIDLFNLIDLGLARNVNTLKENPYK